MSCSTDIEGVLVRKKRLKVLPAASSHQDENKRPKQCFCFEKSECVVRELRAARQKEFLSVRRKLDFGPEEDSSQDLFSVQLQDQERSKLLWNFDFNEELPLPGKWAWMKEEERTVPKSSGESTESTSVNVKHKTLKDLFPVSKNNRSRKRPLDSSFRLPLARMRSTETSPA